MGEFACIIHRKYLIKDQIFSDHSIGMPGLLICNIFRTYLIRGYSSTC